MTAWDCWGSASAKLAVLLIASASSRTRRRRSSNRPTLSETLNASKRASRPRAAPVGVPNSLSLGRRRPT